MLVPEGYGSCLVLLCLVVSDIPCNCLFARNFSLIRQNKFPVRACAGNGTLVLESSYQSSAKSAESGAESRIFPAFFPVGREFPPQRLGASMPMARRAAPVAPPLARISHTPCGNPKGRLKKPTGVRRRAC